MATGDANDGHSHPLVAELLVVHKSTGQIQIEDEVFELCPGSVAIVPAGKFHAVCNTGNENLEGITIFDANFDRKQVVLKNRKEHLAGKATSGASAHQAALEAEIAALNRQMKRLKKSLKKKQKAA